MDYVIVVGLYVVEFVVIVCGIDVDIVCIDYIVGFIGIQCVEVCVGSGCD